MQRKIFLAILILTITAGFLLFDSAQAASTDNVSGFAWSENIGWISFNNTSGGGSTSYGVNINTSTGVISGYAWSENLGWISFNRSDTGAPPGPPDYGTYLAQVDFSTKQVSGWARVLAYDGGWDGWIKLSSTNFGVSVDNSVSPAEFRGWAWTDTVLGWLSFNCSNQGTCGTFPYKVVTSFSLNRPPTASPSSPTQGNYCGAPYPPIYLSWIYSDPDGDPQSAYQVQIDDNADFSSPLQDTGQIISSSNTYAPASLPYNTTLYWRVKVWDSKNNASNWAVGSSFTTASHAYPSVDFSYLPAVPRLNQNTAFTDQTTVFGGATKSSWFWTFQDGVPPTSNQQNPTIQFSAIGQKSVSLQVTDSSGFSCTASKNITVQQVSPTPKYKEIPPVSWLLNLFAFIRKNTQNLWFSNISLKNTLVNLTKSY